MKKVHFLFTCVIFICLISSFNCSQRQESAGAGKLRRFKRSRFRKLRSTENNENKGAASADSPLMVLMLDGFRWDYYHRLQRHMPGFTRFLQTGTHAKHVEPIFPPLSFPSWTTLSTGVWPETHGITGNYMIDMKNISGLDTFSLREFESTTQEKWWQRSEPIWITATKHKKRAFLRYWSSCEAAYQGIKPEECLGFRNDEDGIKSISRTLTRGLERLNAGFDLVMIYGAHIDNIGHTFGPSSYELQLALSQLDKSFSEFLKNLDKHPKLKEKLNMIIVSDHGMTDLHAYHTEYLNIEDYVSKDNIYRALDTQSVIAIQPEDGKLQKVYDQLKGRKGFDVYKRDEIPEEYHFKNSPYVLDLLLVARAGYVIRGFNSQKQLPHAQDQDQLWSGSHGYTPAMKDQRSIFFANGPAFKQNYTHQPIRIIDIYQVFAHVLGVQAAPHNGTWANVEGIFA